MKGQLQSQLFVYIMVIVVASGILIFGYNAVQGFKTDADNVLFLKFETTMKNDFKSLSFGAEQQKTYDLPGSVEEICFKANDAVYASVTEEDPKKLLIASAVETGTANNVFIYPKGDKAFATGTSLDVDTTSLDSVKFKCFDVNNGILKIRLKGQGKSVLVFQTA